MVAMAIKIKLPQGNDDLFNSVLEAGLFLVLLYHFFKELLESFVSLFGLKVIREVLLGVGQNPY